jgi:deoxyribonuclease V
MIAGQVHSWELTPQQAIALQKQLASRVQLAGMLHSCRYVAGADVAYTRSDRQLVAAIVIWDRKHNQVIEQQVVRQPVSFPYVPGLLSFRESPGVLHVWQHLHRQPDLLMIDGHGYAHPRRFGIACHLGVLLDIPTIGCAKSRLIGKHDEVPDQVGAWVPLYDCEEIVGAVLRTRLHVRPIYVSIGHRLDLEQAIFWTMQCCRGYRVPEPTRLAHQLVSRARTQPD